MTNKITVDGIGEFWARTCDDPDYPGIDTEFITSDSSAWDKNLCHPRILFEYDKEEKQLRALIWDDPDEEDYNKEVVFDLDKFLKKD